MLEQLVGDGLSVCIGPIVRLRLLIIAAADLPAAQAVAMAADKTRVVIYTKDKASWEWPATLLKNLGKEKQLQLREPMVPDEAK